MHFCFFFPSATIRAVNLTFVTFFILFLTFREGFIEVLLGSRSSLHLIDEEMQT